MQVLILTFTLIKTIWKKKHSWNIYPQRRLSYLFEASEESIVIYLLVLKLLFVSNERIKNWQANLNLFLVFFTPCKKRLGLFTHVNVGHVNFLEQKNVSPKEEFNSKKDDLEHHAL